MEKVQKRNFEREFNNRQLKRMLRRDAKQLSIQEKIYKLASYLDTNKMLEEKKRLKEKKLMRKIGRKRVNQSLEEKYWSSKGMKSAKQAMKQQQLQ